MRLPTALFAVVTCVTISVATASADQAVYPVPLTIDSTGTTDVTSQLTNFVAGVPDGSTISFRAGGRYRTEGTLRFPNRHNLTIDGAGATLFATTTGSPGRTHVWFAGGGPVTVRDLDVVGANNAS